jgi:histidinol-phosphate/aromatic aminotransferase/cobyric acid decarboxylase-like protein
VWDEAFWQLATGTWTRGDTDSWRLGSLTKLWACPGLRIGYAIAPDEAAAKALRGMQPQWSVSTLAATVVEQLVETSDLTGWSAEVSRRRRELVTVLRGFGLDVTDTDACWVLVNRPDLRRDLLPHGVIVRDCASFGMPGVHRIAVPDDRAAERLQAALLAVLT